MNKTLQKIQKMTGIKQGAFDSKHQQLFMQGQTLLKMTELFIKSVEEAKMTDMDWFINWEDEINALSVKDHNEQTLDTD